MHPKLTPAEIKLLVWAARQLRYIVTCGPLDSGQLIKLGVNATEQKLLAALLHKLDEGDGHQ